MALAAGACTVDDATGSATGEVDQGWYTVYCPGPAYNCRWHEVAPNIFLGGETFVLFQEERPKGVAFLQIRNVERALWYDATLETKCADGSTVTNHESDALGADWFPADNPDRFRFAVMGTCIGSSVSEFNAWLHLDF